MEENRNIAAKGSRHASPRGNSRNTINHTNGSENAVEGRHERRPNLLERRNRAVFVSYLPEGGYYRVRGLRSVHTIPHALK